MQPPERRDDARRVLGRGAVVERERNRALDQSGPSVGRESRGDQLVRDRAADDDLRARRSREEELRVRRHSARHPLVEWLLAIPHHIVLFFLFIGAIVAIIVAWFAILFTGRYPRSLFDYLQGVGRWNNRVVAYALVLVTDEYPPFRLAP